MHLLPIHIKKYHRSECQLSRESLYQCEKPPLKQGLNASEKAFIVPAEAVLGQPLEKHSVRLSVNSSTNGGNRSHQELVAPSQADMPVTTYIPYIFHIYSHIYIHTHTPVTIYSAQEIPEQYMLKSHVLTAVLYCPFFF